MTTPTDKEREFAEATERVARKKNLDEIMACVQASLAIARALVTKDDELTTMVSDLEKTWDKTFSDFLGLSVAISSLRLRPPEEIATYLALWKQKVDEKKAATFLSYRYEQRRDN